MMIINIIYIIIQPILIVWWLLICNGNTSLYNLYFSTGDGNERLWFWLWAEIQPIAQADPDKPDERPKRRNFEDDLRNMDDGKPDDECWRTSAGVPVHLHPSIINLKFPLSEYVHIFYTKQRDFTLFLPKTTAILVV